MADQTEEEFVVGPREIRSDAEYLQWYEARRSGFTAWYVGRPPAGAALARERLAANAKARLFPDFFHQARTKSGRAAAYLASVPAFWSGDPNALQDLAYYDDVLQFDSRKGLALAGLYGACAGLLHRPALFDRLAAPQRQRKLAGANSVVLIALTVDPAFRKAGLPQRLVASAIQTARKLGFAQIVSPFRPSAYGAYKAERRVAHSNELFKEYVQRTNDAGLPIDPWLRGVKRLGATFVKIEPRSFRVAKPIAEFERFRREHRPADWYSPTPDVWECGETPTWYVDRCRQQVVSVESNVWGRIAIG